MIDFAKPNFDSLEDTAIYDEGNSTPELEYVVNEGEEKGVVYDTVKYIEPLVSPLSVPPPRTDVTPGRVADPPLPGNPVVILDVGFPPSPP
jgi:hypothetical protein